MAGIQLKSGVYGKLNSIDGVSRNNTNAQVTFCHDGASASSQTCIRSYPLNDATSFSETPSTPAHFSDTDVPLALGHEATLPAYAVLSDFSVILGLGST
jgi:hypothetical protein